MKIVYISLLLVCICGCNNQSNSFDELLLRDIHLCDMSDPCIVSISKMTDFEWDEMYVFKYNATLSDVSSVLGSKPPKFTEFSKRIVFLLKKQIVYYREIEVDISGPTKDELIFDIGEYDIYERYEIDNAKFKVEKESMGNGNFFYILNHVGSIPE